MRLYLAILALVFLTGCEGTWTLTAGVVDPSGEAYTASAPVELRRKPKRATATPAVVLTPTPTPPPTLTPTLPPTPSPTGTPAPVEIRPSNATANATTRTPRPLNCYVNEWWNDPYCEHFYPQITGAKTGTTAQLLEWGAAKWGLPADFVKAIAVVESTWYQSTKGDYHDGGPWYPGMDYQSYGLLQVKRSVWPNSYPESAESTAFNIDYALSVNAFHRSPYTYISNPTGDRYIAAQAWYCGCSNDGVSDWYIKNLRAEEVAKRWLLSGF